MKLIVKMYRVTTVRTDELIAAAGYDPDSITNTEKLISVMREKFAPFAPRFKIFYPAEIDALTTVAGMEAMSFDVSEAEHPRAGLVLVDPMDPNDVARTDGALESELNRIGVGTDFVGYEWRLAYEVKGN